MREARGNLRQSRRRDCVRALLLAHLLVLPRYALGQTSRRPSAAEIVRALEPPPSGASTQSERSLLEDLRGIRVNRSIDLDVPFSFNASTPTSDGISVLRQLGLALINPRLANGRFRLIGHTDARGDAAYNLRLSERRAGWVKEFLIKEYRIAPDRIEALGRGKAELRDPSDPNGEVNRRVEVISVPP